MDSLKLRQQSPDLAAVKELMRINFIDEQCDDADVVVDK